MAAALWASIAVAVPVLVMLMNYPAAELRGIKMNFYLINPDAEHRGILLINSLDLLLWF
jgi:hypothetical protein